MNKYLYPIYKSNLKPWIKYWLIKKTSAAPITGTYTLAEGQTPLTITDSLVASIRNLTLYGDCYQEQREGTNILNINNYASLSSNGIEATIDTTNGTVTLNGTATANAFFTFTLPQTYQSGTTVSMGVNNSEINNNVSFRLTDNATSTTTPNQELNVINKVENNRSPSFDFNKFQLRIVNGTQLTNFVVKPQVNLSSSILPFEPYGYHPSPTNPSPVQTITGDVGFSIQQDLTVNFKQIRLGSIELCQIGDYEDLIYKENDNWYIEKNIGKVVLNGSESWDYFPNIQSSNLFRLYGVITDYRKNVAGYCDHYKTIPNQDNRANFDLYFRNDATIALDILDNRFTSATDYKTWLASNNVSVYYVLSEPVTTEITNQNLLSDLAIAEALETFEGTNVIKFSNLTPNVSLEYLKKD